MITPLESLIELIARIEVQRFNEEETRKGKPHESRNLRPIQQRQATRILHRGPSAELRKIREAKRPPSQH